MEQKLERYWELIELNDFDNLNDSDQLFIRTYFTQTDFEADRKISVFAKNDSDPTESNRKALVMAHATTKKENKILPPAIAFVAGLAIMFGFFHLFKDSAEGFVITKKEFVVDTVFQQKIVRDTITIKEVSAPEIKYVYRDNYNKKENVKDQKFPKTQALVQKQFREPNQSTPTLAKEEIENKGTSGIENSFVVEIPSEMNNTFSGRR